MRRRLPECRIAVITTGGVHLVDQAPFDMADPHGDPSYRIIPVGTPRSRLTITHNYYDHSDAEVVTRLPVVAPWLMRVKFP